MIDESSAPALYVYSYYPKNINFSHKRDFQMVTF